MGLAINEENKTEKAIEFYDILSSMLYTPSTPTLFNSGTVRSQLSSCYLNTFDDSIDGIFDGAWQEARKSKYAGGLGLDVTPFRSTGSHIKGTNGISSGLVPWLKIYTGLATVKPKTDFDPAFIKASAQALMVDPLVVTSSIIKIDFPWIF